MKADVPGLQPGDREALRRIARSRRVPHGLATRAQLVVDCADLGISGAAQRASVSETTAAKWWRRYREGGIGALHDVPRRGRPTAPDDVVRRVLGCALEDPPAGAARWSTRTIADATGVSQASVSRIRRRSFPKESPISPLLQQLSTAILTYVDVGESGCAVGFAASNGESAVERDPPPALADAVETVVCARLLRPTYDARATTLLNRLTRHVSGPMTVIVDCEIDDAARQWISRHPDVDVDVHHVPGADWLTMRQAIWDTIDLSQATQLREVQQLIRAARRDGVEEFSWWRTTDPASVLRTASVAAKEPPGGDLSYVVRGICMALSAGDLSAGDAVSPRSIARLSGVSPGRVADALAVMAEDALIDRQSGRYLIPALTTRDVIETYTARGLLGTAIARRLASDESELPPVVEEQLAGIARCHESGRLSEASAIDLDLQDELARACGMPRIGAMFIRLTLQLRLFIAIFGLHYRYPTAEILADDGLILAEIRRGDPEAAVAAWRRKIDNCAQYMLNFATERPVKS
ncbi:helix-turn-helix domain-containing protein [Gordonia asplenii]|uniref:helix-turn-helix domain-containing protein n=1 Tax=Gordonia asplenii TaxID=2725283 RepID=UPI0028ADFFEC|nr:helix-turn-helix domain-containing protein [Gordonia asplenii]